MANNPLYPGYIPKKEGQESMNPIYPGYYTGGPMYRKPKEPELIPMEYNFDELINQINSVAKDVTDSPFHPKWIVDRIASDWKQQLSVSVSPTIKIDPTDLDDYATDDLAGVTTKLSLNPKDWGVGDEKGLEKTKIQARKTLNSWFQEATGINRSNLLESNFSEIQNNINHRLWTNALGYGETGANDLERRGAEAIAEKTLEMYGTSYSGGYTLSPLDLRYKEGVNSSGQRIIEKDDEEIYRKTAAAVADFQRGRDSPRFRDSLHTTFIKSAVTAVNEEIKSSEEFKRATPKQKAVVGFFDKKVKTLDLIEEVNTTAKNAAEGLEKVAFTPKAWRVSKTKEQSIKEVANASKKALSEQRKRLEELLKLDTSITSVIPAAEIDRFMREVEKYTDRIKEIEGTLDNVLDQKINLRNAIKSINNPQPKKNFVTRSTFQDSLGGNLRRDLELSILNKSDNDIGGFINARGSSLIAKKISPIMHRMRQDHLHYGAKEVIDILDSGGLSKVAETYLYKIAKNKLPGTLDRITSGSIVGDTLKRTNYFGLKIDYKGTPPDEYFDLHPRIKRRFERRYGNKTNVTLNNDLGGLVGDDRSNKIRVAASEVHESRLKYLENLNKERLSKGLAENKISSLAIIGDENLLKKFNFNKSVDDQVLFARLINHDRSEDALDKLAQKLFGKDGEIKNFSDLNAIEKENIHKFFTKIDYANNWVYQKTGGKIKALEMQKGVLNLNKDSLKDFLNNSGLVGVNKDWLKVDKLSIDYGKHLNIFYNGKLNGFLGGAASVEDKEKILKDLFDNANGFDRAKSWKETILLELFGKNKLNDGDKGKFTELSQQLNVFKQWLKTQRSVFGDIVDSDDFAIKMFMQIRDQGVIKGFKAVSVDQNDKSFLLIKSIFDKNGSMNQGYRLTDKRYLGRLEKINDKLHTLQINFNKSFLGKLIKKISTSLQIASEKIATFIAKLLGKFLGSAAATTVVLGLLAPVIQAVLEKILKKGIKYTTTFLKAIFKLDFKDFEKLLDKDLKNIVQLLVASCSCLGILMLPGIFLIFIIGSIISPIDYTLTNSEGYDILPTSGEPDSRVFGCDLVGTGMCDGKGECTQSYNCGAKITNKVSGVGGFFYGQCDPTWGGLPMSLIPDAKGKLPTICSWGCALTSKAMIYKYFGYPWNPAQLLNEEDGVSHLDEEGYLKSFDLRVDDIHLEIVHNVLPANENRSVAIAALKDFFNNYPAGIAMVKTNKGGDFCFSQHWVVVSGPCGDNDFILYDPYRGPDAALLSEYPSEPLPGIFGYYVGDGQCAVTNPLDDPIGDPLNCGKGPDPDCIARPGPAPSNFANRALEVACNLRPGFECLYNRPLFDAMPPMYSHSGNIKAHPGLGTPLFDSALFASNPGAPENHGNYAQLFWCTWLPIKVYNSLVSSQHGALGVYMAADGLFDLGANSMCQQISRRELGFRKYDEPESGDIACYDWNGDNLMDHVGVVYKVLKNNKGLPEGVYVVESNGGWVYNFYAKSDNKYNYIKYFGRQGGGGGGVAE